MEQKLLFLSILFLCSCGKQYNVKSIDYYKEHKVEQTSVELKASLTKKLEDIANKSDQYGIGVVILNKDSILYKKAFGKNSAEAGTDFTLNTVMLIGSVTKTLVGVSLIKAAELGFLSLEDDINKYLPYKIINPHHPNLPIKIKHLATHTSSLEYTKYYEHAYIFEDTIQPLDDQLSGKEQKKVKSMVDLHNSNQVISMEEFIKNIYVKGGKWYEGKNYLKDEPGTTYSYCNENAAIAALIIESATNTSFKVFVQKYILTPLNIRKSSWSMSNYSPNEKGQLYMYKQAIPNYNLITYPDGGFVTNINEFTPYFQNLIKGYYGEDGILTAKGFQLLFKKHFKKGDTESGVFIEFDGNQIGHTGSDPGIMTFATFDKETSFGYLLFFKSDEFYTVIEALDEVQKYCAYLITTKN